MRELIYLDHAATTPLRASALAAMLPVFEHQFANPSGSHRFARQARQLVDEARDIVAARCGWHPGGVVFTSGGTEADNAIIAGVTGLRPTGAATAVCSAAEHHAVLAAVENCAEHCIVAVDGSGHIDLEHLAASIDECTAIVSVMAVNNEVGTITDLAAVASVVRCRAPQAVLHTDAVQAAPWLDLRPLAAHVDAISLSAHKFGGPKGVGALLVGPTVKWSPLLVGGGQERGLRSGTHNVAGIVGMAAALDETDCQRDSDVCRVGELRNRLVDGLVAELGGGSDESVVETVRRDRKVPGAAHLMFRGVENEALLFMLDDAGVCASAASACASGAMEPSHVLAAMGIDPTLGRGAVRLTLGPSSTAADVDEATPLIADAVRRLRARR